jgi:hypothetical protein
MRMIPDTPHGTHSLAEKRVFDRLRAAFAGGDYTAYHSLNLTRHAYKRFGEIDFLVCGPEGLFVLEVKGGGVSCQRGYWRYANRYGEVAESAEGPFKQAQSALHGLLAKLRESLPEPVLAQFAIGYGVIFPDCVWPTAGAEWEPWMLADARACHDLEGWLRRLFVGWRNRDSCHRHPDAEALAALRARLRPEFEAAVPLYIQMQGIEERIATLTEDQMALVDVVAANPRAMCSGGAGTGKTFLAMELARRWTAEGMKVALACRSPWLKSYLETHCALGGLTVALTDGLHTACRRLGLSHFDALIIDEGQDVLDQASLERMDASVKGGLAGGRWCFFYDLNNQAGFFGVPDPVAIERLSAAYPAHVPLRTNCRNTRVILESVRSALGADMGVRGAGDGPQVRERRAFHRAEAARWLAEEIDALTGPGGMAPGGITLLSPYRFVDSCAAELPERLRRDILVLDQYSLRNFPTGKTSFSEIGSFKGLENEAVIVLDLPIPMRGAMSLASHYVAMSRARSLLSLIYLRYLRQ